MRCITAFLHLLKHPSHLPNVSRCAAARHSCIYSNTHLISQINQDALQHGILASTQTPISSPKCIEMRCITAFLHLLKHPSHLPNVSRCAAARHSCIYSNTHLISQINRDALQHGILASTQTPISSPKCIEMRCITAFLHLLKHRSHLTISSVFHSLYFIQMLTTAVTTLNTRQMTSP